MTATGDLLDHLRHDLFEFADAVDTKDPDLGNASGAAINFRYMDLDNDCAGLANEINGAMNRLKLFIDVYLQATGQGDFTGEQFSLEFNMDMPVNETEVINNAIQSSAILSQETVLANHPWVDDVQQEMERLKAQREEAVAEFGEFRPPAAAEHNHAEE
jgi:SPP1 family phage portal protein